MKALFVCDGRLRHFADSSLQRNGQPWFMPDISKEWVAIVCPGIKITRLGTHIAAKFAGRYYESICAVTLFLPAREAVSPSEAPERFFVSDSAYCIGEGVTVGEKEQLHEINVGEKSLKFSSDSLGVDTAISDISKFVTLKIGDVIIFGDERMDLSVAEGDRLEVAIDGERAIELRIK
ncbi:MAG: hypothetical protein K2M54_04825 [Muribaculaceae bacterium]|nr:hypothetical protein [Muribaculaceae bacterium]